MSFSPGPMTPSSEEMDQNHGEVEGSCNERLMQYDTDDSWRSTIYRPIQATRCRHIPLIVTFLLLGATGATVVFYMLWFPGGRPSSSHANQPASHIRIDGALSAGVEPEEKSDYCGDSYITAMQRGCVFDLFMAMWTPPECFDSEVFQRYLPHVQNYTWYLDAEGIQVLSTEVALTGNFPHKALYTQTHFHVVHCEYSFAKLAMAARKPTMGIAGSLLIDWHINHCLDIISGREHYPDRRVDGRQDIEYSSCYRRVS